MSVAAGLAGSAALSATGCGTTESARGGETPLTVIATDYGDLEGNDLSQVYWDELVRSFHRENPGIRVEVFVHSRESVGRRVADLVKQRRAPDIAQVGSYADYAADGRLYTADELLSVQVQADFLPSLAEAGEVKRVQYGLPFVAAIEMLFYNKTLFAKADLDPEDPPRTWQELKRAATALKAAGVNVPYGLPLGPEDAQTEAMTWMLSNDGGYTDSSGSYTIDSAANIETFQWLREELVGEGLTTVSPATTERAALFDLFARGEVGMLNGSPTLMQQADRKRIDYGTAPLPGNRKRSKSTTGVAHWLMGFKDNGRRQEIGAFLDHVLSEKNHYAFADRYHLLPVTVSSSDRMRSEKKHKRLWPFLDQLPTAEFAPADKPSWSQTSQAVKKSIGRAVGEDGDPAAVLDSLQSVAESQEAAAGL